MIILTDPNEAYSAFSIILENHLARATFLKRKGKYETLLKPWISTGLLNSIKTKDKLYKSSSKNPNNVALKNKYKTYRNILTKTLRAAKFQFFRERFRLANKNMKQIWNTITLLLTEQIKKEN